MLELPNDLKNFLNSGRRLEYDASACECGRVVLLRPEQLKIEAVFVDGQSLNSTHDPNVGRLGSYRVEAVNLVSNCDDYDPRFILAWVPRSKVYGSWDCDHNVLTVFHGRTWADITESPLEFLNSQWEDSGVGTPLIPWPDYPFIPGDR